VVRAFPLVQLAVITLQFIPDNLLIPLTTVPASQYNSQAPT